MLPLKFWNSRIFTPSTLTHLNRPFRFRHLTPISSYHNFLRNQFGSDEAAKQKTGFVYTKCNQLNLYRPIHSSTPLSFKNYDALGQKIENGKQKSTEIEKKEVTLDALEESKTLGLFAKFKKMGKDYWYVLIPVHVVTSAGWLGAFYYTSTSGVDIVGILEHYEFNEKIINHLKNSSLGHAAVAYFLYKIFTPARYFVTLAGTTFVIRQGIQRGLIKPMPSKDALVQIYKDKKDDLKERVADKKQAFQDRKQEFQDKYMKKEE